MATVKLINQSEAPNHCLGHVFENYSKGEKILYYCSRKTIQNLESQVHDINLRTDFKNNLDIKFVDIRNLNFKQVVKLLKSLPYKNKYDGIYLDRINDTVMHSIYGANTILDLLLTAAVNSDTATFVVADENNTRNSPWIFRCFNEKGEINII